MRVEKYFPIKDTILTGKVSITFTKDIDRGSVKRNFIIVNDNKSVPIDIRVVDRTISIESNIPKGKNTVHIMPGLKSIDGNCASPFSFEFLSNGKDDTYMVNYPIDSTIISSLDRVEFKSSSKSTRIQVSSDISFSNILINDVSTHEYVYIVDKPLPKGNYFIRVGSDNNWSDISSVYIEPYISEIENEIDSAFIETENIKKTEMSVKPSFDKYISKKLSNIQITINEILIPTFNDFYLYRVVDLLKEEEVNEKIDIKAISYSHEDNCTNIILQLGDV